MEVSTVRDYVIGSFNLRDFHLDSSGEKKSRDFRKIAEIIIKENFDVVALQEINEPAALKLLIEQLNRWSFLTREYQYRCGEASSTSCLSRDPERYGFIWNAKRLRLLDTYFSNPRYYKDAGAENLTRLPYYGRFTARGMLGGANFELRIVNIHASAGKDKISEFEILIKQVLPRICDHQELSTAGEQMPAYTFLMGDYNLSLCRGERAVYRIETVTETRYTGKKRIYETVQEEPTTLGMPKAQMDVEECYAHDYDHFTYEDELGRKLLLVPQRVEALGKYFPEMGRPSEKLRDYREKISDHVPIKLTVKFR